MWAGPPRDPAGLQPRDTQLASLQTPTGRSRTRDSAGVPPRRAQLGAAPPPSPQAPSLRVQKGPGADKDAPRPRPPTRHAHRDHASLVGEPIASAADKMVLPQGTPLPFKATPLDVAPPPRAGEPITPTTKRSSPFSPNTPLPFSGPTSRAGKPIASVGDKTAPPLDVAPPPESEKQLRRRPGGPAADTPLPKPRPSI